MKTTKTTILSAIILGLFALPAAAWAQDDDQADEDSAKEETPPLHDNSALRAEVVQGGSGARDEMGQFPDLPSADSGR